MKHSFKVVLVYSDAEGARTGMKVAEGLKKHQAEGQALAESRWKTELLKSPKLRKIAAREAAQASVIIISAREGLPLPQEVAEWLSEWRLRKGRGKATLVALLTRSECEAVPQVAETLHHFATAAKIDFFCHSKVDQTRHRWAEAWDQFQAPAE